MSIYTRILSILLVFLLLFSGCSTGGNVIADHKNEAYNRLADRVDAISASFETSGSATGNSVTEDSSTGNSASGDSTSGESASYGENKAFDQADDRQRAAIALDMADDMALSQTFNLVTNDMLVMAGKAVKAYPHPILLNNYAAMLLGNGNTGDALYFFKLSLNQEPNNTILLTNIANVYLDMENYSEAEKYAKRALAATEDYGPAYQVLTTIHLKNGNSELAAETMVKSAKHCFNSITMYHFGSFLDAVMALDPAEDEYPLKEEYISELYDIAKENVDTKETNGDVDTPSGQIKIKPFPQISSADHLIKSREYLSDEREKISDKMSDAEQQYNKYYNALSDHLDKQEDTEAGVLPVKKNIRQVYAFMVLRSYYEYKVRQAEEKLYTKLDDLQTQRDEKLNKTAENYYTRTEEARNKTENASDQVLGELIAAMDGGKLPDPLKVYEASLIEMDIKIEQAEAEFTLSKQYVNEITTATQNCYDDMKQTLEEFWLRSGGLLKYLTIEDVFNQLDIEREKMVYEHIGMPFAVLEEQADFLTNKKDQLDSSKHDKQVLLDSLSGVVAEYEEVKEEEQRRLDSIVPDIEKEAISEYPEKSALGDIGMEGGFFGLLSGSIQYNGEKFSFEADTPLGGIGGERSIVNEKVQKEVYYAAGARVEGSTEWLTDSKLISGSLQTAGNAGKAAAKLGKISFGYTNGIKTGEYMTTDENNRVIDRGMIHIREVGGEIWKFGKSKQVVVKKSYMTGVATKKTTTKYKFEFATYSE